MSEGASGEITVEEQRIAEAVRTIAALQETASGLDASVSLSQCAGPGSESVKELSERVQFLAGALSEVLFSARNYLAASGEAFKQEDELIARNMANLGKG